MSMINLGPSIMVAQNDEEAISIINMMSGNNYTTISDALAWVATQNDIFVQSDTTENIVTDGMVLFLDEADIESYPKTGTTWYDLSNDTNGTLVDGVSYNSSNNGIEFDGTGYFNYTESMDFGTGDFTFEWLGIPSNYTNHGSSWNCLISKGTLNDSNYWGLFFTSNNDVAFRINGTTTTGYFFDSGTTVHIVGNRSGTTQTMYIDGDFFSDNTNASVALSPDNAHPFRLANDDQGSIRCNDCTIFYASVYNRSLTSDEIQQNYNALKHRYSLVFGYEMDNTNSYIGEPTTNLSYESDNQLDWMSGWNNSGNATRSTNDLTINKPFPGYSVISMLVTEDGSLHLGCGSASITTSTEYTVSVWFWQNRIITSSASPYCRPQPHNTNQGKLEYNGSTDWHTWPTNEWIRITKTYTTPATDVTSMYISSYGGVAGDKYAFYAPQIEQKSHMTQFTGPVRTNTTGLLDLTGNFTLDLSNVSFDSDANFYFNNVDNYLDMDDFDYSNGFSIIAVIKPISLGETAGRIIDKSSDMGGVDGFFLTLDANNKFYFKVDNTGEIVTPNNSFNFDEYCFVCSTCTTSGYGEIYVNGELKATGTTAGVSNITTVNTPRIGNVAFETSRTFDGEISLVNIYNTPLSQQEVSYKYDTLKDRFNLS